MALNKIDINYPLEGKVGERTLIGGVLSLTSAFLFPLIFLFGYYVDIFRETKMGNDTPPEFTTEKLGQYTLDGLVATGVFLFHSLIIALPLTAILLTVTSGDPTMASTTSPSGGLATGSSIPWIILGMLGIGLVTIAYTAITVPASLGLYVNKDSTLAMISPLQIIKLIFTKNYIIASILSSIIGLMLAGVTFVLALIPLIGGLISVFIQFPALVLTQRIFAVAITTELSHTQS